MNPLGRFSWYETPALSGSGRAVIVCPVATAFMPTLPADSWAYPATGQVREIAPWEYTVAEIPPNGGICWCGGALRPGAAGKSAKRVSVTPSLPVSEVVVLVSVSCPYDCSSGSTQPPRPE